MQPTTKTMTAPIMDPRAGTTVANCELRCSTSFVAWETEAVIRFAYVAAGLLDESTRAHLRGRRHRLPLDREPVVDRGPLGGDSSP